MMIVQPILWLCSTTSARAQDLQNGDLLVGAANDFGFGDLKGVLLRVRSGVTTPFCASDPILDPDLNFAPPPQVMVDSQGRVVFIAGDKNRFGMRMFRCSTLGGPVEKLAFFHADTFGVTPPVGVAVPFPGKVFVSTTFAGLHLAKTRAIIIDDAINGGQPRVTTEDVYTFTAQELTEQNGVITLGATHTYRFHTTTGAWEIAKDAGSDFPQPPTDLINHSGTTFSIYNPAPVINLPQTLRRASNPLKLSASGSAGGIDFSAEISMFGGFKEVNGLILDDLEIPNVDSGCPPALDGISNLMPLDPSHGGFLGMTGFGNIAYDEFGDLALVVTSNSGAAGTPYLANVSQALLDDDPNNDRSQLFHNSFVGCAAIPTLQHRSLVPFSDPQTGSQNSIDWIGTNKALVSTLRGLAATQSFTGSVIRIERGHVEVVASGIFSPLSIGAYPNGVQPPEDGAIVVRIDSPVNVLITDPDGKRIGVDASGQPANDFGSGGFDSGSGEPRFFAIRNPATGSYAVQAVGTGNGSFTVHVYSVDLSRPDGQHIQTTGIAAPGSTANEDFTLAADGSIAFVAPPPSPDTIPPTTTATLTVPPNSAGWNNSDVTVTFSASDNRGGSGVKEISYVASGATSASATVSGSVASLQITAEGVTTVTYFARDNAGNAESRQTLIVRLDKTPPTIAGTRTPLPNANGWNNTDVTVGFTCADSLSGLAPGSPPAATMLTAEGANQAVGGTCMDIAGNSASAAVSGINIDKSPPILVVAANPPPNGNGWNNSDVTVSFAAVDALSGVDIVSGPVTLTSEGAGQVVTGSATDKAGNLAVARVTLNIDKTPPEAFNQFDPINQDLAVFGRDSLSGVPPGALTPISVVPANRNDEDDASESGDDNEGAELRTYKVLDAAGNFLLLVEKVKKEGHEIKARVVSLQYGNGPVLTAPSNREDFEWALGKDGTLKELEQKLELGVGKERQELEAKFEAKKNQSTITREEPEPETKVIKPGLVLLRMATHRGALVLEF